MVSYPSRSYFVGLDGLQVLQPVTLSKKPTLEQQVSEKKKDKTVDISEIRLMPDKGLRKTFDEAIKYWKTQKEDMAAMPDFYNRFKKIINWYDEGGRKRKAAEAQLKSLQQDFRNGWVFSNTIFIPNISFGNMIHYFQTKKEKSSNLDIPLLNRETTEMIFYSKEQSYGYLPRMFDTNDKLEDIIQTLKFISNHDRIELEYPDSRNSLYVVAVCHTIKSFHISCKVSPELECRSRGI